MPQLIISVTSNILDNFSTSVILFNSVTAQVQQEDYINLNGFTAYLQNFSKIEFTQTLQKPLTFGLVNTYNVPMVTLNISY